MTDSSKSPVLAIDGGGTRCRFALQREGERITAEAGSANAFTDFDNTVRCLQDGIQSLAQLAQTKAAALHGLPAFVGLAGVTGDAMVARLTAALPLQNVRYADDRLAALRGALGLEDGLVAHCGTGSFFAAQTERKTRFAGGWGPTLGDEASAQWIGRMALTQLLRRVDGLAATSALTEDLMSHFGDVQGVVEFSRTANPALFGSLARKVTMHAANGDAVASTILREGASHIESTLRQMGWQPGMAICLTGGLGPHYAPYLPNDMAPNLATPLGEPLDGAIALAQELEMTHGNR